QLHQRVPGDAGVGAHDRLRRLWGGARRRTRGIGVRRRACRAGAAAGIRRHETGRDRPLDVRRDVRGCSVGDPRGDPVLRGRAGGWDTATIRCLPTGTVQVLTGTSPHGQGHETTWSQIAADQLGYAVDEIEVLHGDTAVVPLGMDTYGSRSLAVGGVALYHAAE